ncbi:alpha-(1,3)-fucosyltransferase C [Patella vulgata]|uniref:alpha-(1,3)-fucosyltransferase C n=1 Tax=Patella vulgata TaxID=6465 RepID=UPI00217FCBD4|nr:alpha-(1,3)-fucosyltransferase C [Patella vulgata]
MMENRKRKLAILLVTVLTVILYLTNLKATKDVFVKFLKREMHLNSSKDDTKAANEVFVKILKETMPLNSSKDDANSIHANNVKSKHSNNPKSEHSRNLKPDHSRNLKSEQLQPEHPSNPYILTSVSSHFNTRSSNKPRSNKTRGITIHWYNRPSEVSSQALRNWFSPCNDSCIYTEDINSDILIFDGDSLAGNPPVRRNPNQVWVFHEMESPDITFSHQWLKPSWRNKFNRTFTYRVDSDQFIPYGFYRKRKEPLKKNITAIMKQKAKLVSIFSSNCGVASQREKYIKLLRKYIPVDFYGRCGNLTCPKSYDCFISNAKTYKFYLSFENSLCRDYVSEKFFRAESLDIVAVTRGGANYSKIAPAKTYIDTSDFKSVKDLANFLLYLDRNDTAYRQYLENKQSFESIYWWFGTGDNFMFMHKLSHCGLCNKARSWLNEKKVYENIGDWYEKNKCHKPADIH